MAIHDKKIKKKTKKIVIEEYLLNLITHTHTHTHTHKYL